jgi:hypothetical protein
MKQAFLVVVVALLTAPAVAAEVPGPGGTGAATTDKAPPAANTEKAPPPAVEKDPPTPPDKGLINKSERDQMQEHDNDPDAKNQ